MQTPAVAALMTTYNSARYVSTTVDSVLAQSMQDFELVVVDDGSTDDTVALLQSYQDPRIRLFCRADNRGVGYSLHEALLQVRAPVVIKVDSDDISHPQRFAKQLAYLQQHPELSLVKCYFSYFADNAEVAASARFAARLRDAEQINSINTEELIAEHLPRWLCVEHTTYCARTEAVRAAGYPDQRLCEDYALFYRMAQNGCRMGCLPEVLVQMRLSQHSVTAELDAQKFKLWFRYLLAFKLPRLQQLCGPTNQLAIYGTGGLAKLMYELLGEVGFTVSYFIGQHAEPAVTVGDFQVDVRALTQCLHDKIVIAAQPVRLTVMQQLTTLGLQEWRDFMVVA